MSLTTHATLGGHFMETNNETNEKHLGTFVDAQTGLTVIRELTAEELAEIATDE